MKKDKLRFFKRLKRFNFKYFKNKIFDYELIRKSKVKNHSNQIKKLIDLYKIDLVIDAGANVGQFAKSVRKNGYKNQIISFEPVRETFALLLDASKNDSLWECYNYGLGESAKEVEIFTSGESSLNSILPPTELGGELTDFLNNQQKELISITTLDKFIKEKGLLGRRIFLKMDTQGYDLEVFRGARGTLDSIFVLQAEVAIQKIYQDMPDYMVSLSEFQQNGFIVSGFYPVTETQKNGAALEMDCIMVRNVTLT